MIAAAVRSDWLNMLLFVRCLLLLHLNVYGEGIVCHCFVLYTVDIQCYLHKILWQQNCHCFWCNLSTSLRTILSLIRRMTTPIPGRNVQI